MPYKVQSSEKLRKIGADFETKAMLYLLNFRQDSSEINYFIVDFFNDITGMDRMGRKLWDVQSKASKSGSAKTIGRELVTLYKNYVSDFQFFKYIIFLGAVPDSFRIVNSETVFKLSNIQDKAVESLFSGLKDECEKKEYISTKEISDEKLHDFLNNVWFVVDDKEPKEYIIEIIKSHPKIIPQDSVLISIFNEIRNKQSEKKNTLVEGVVINKIDEVLAYGRHLTNGEIRLLVLQRIINNDPLSKGIPDPFMDIYSKFPEESRLNMVEQCQRALCMALFNKSTAQGFWKLFEAMYNIIIKYPQKNVDFIFHKIDDDIKDECPDFDVLSLKYFIAKINEGIL